MSLYSDYEGAKDAGMHAFLLRRPGPEGEHAHKEVNEMLDGVDVIKGLNQILQMVEIDQSV